MPNVLFAINVIIKAIKKKTTKRTSGISPRTSYQSLGEQPTTAPSDTEQDESSVETPQEVQKALDLGLIHTILKWLLHTIFKWSLESATLH